MSKEVCKQIREKIDAVKPKGEGLLGPATCSAAWCEHISHWCGEWILINLEPQTGYCPADDWKFCPRCGAPRPKQTRPNIGAEPPRKEKYE